MALANIKHPELSFDSMDTSFFLARAELIDQPGGFNRFRFGLFSSMFRQAESAASHFNLPPNRVVELGTQIGL